MGEGGGEEEEEKQKKKKKKKKKMKKKKKKKKKMKKKKKKKKRNNNNYNNNNNNNNSNSNSNITYLSAALHEFSTGLALLSRQEIGEETLLGTRQVVHDEDILAMSLLPPDHKAQPPLVHWSEALSRELAEFPV